MSVTNPSEMAAAPGQWGNLCADLQHVAQGVLQIVNNPPLTIEHLNVVQQAVTHQIQALGNRLDNQFQLRYAAVLSSACHSMTI